MDDFSKIYDQWLKKDEFFVNLTQAGLAKERIEEEWQMAKLLLDYSILEACFEIQTPDVKAELNKGLDIPQNKDDMKELINRVRKHMQTHKLADLPSMIKLAEKCYRENIQVYMDNLKPKT